MFSIGRIASNANLTSLALPPDALATWRAVVARRTGTVLLPGPSGTGKTLAAEVLAGTLGRALMRVDTARVTSPFIGETEKNLDRLFATATASNAVLFFDEADALFGKRSGVASSHDRYANLEVGYLLQKIEAFNGLVILAIGAHQRIDPAVLRRLRHIAELPWPPKRG